MKKFTFESEYTDPQENVLRVTCADSEGDEFSVLIDTWDDPYNIYYPLGALDPAMEDEFRDQIFEYLTNKYPGCF